MKQFSYLIKYKMPSFGFYKMTFYKMSKLFHEDCVLLAV